MSDLLRDACALKGGTGFPESLQGNQEGDLAFIKVSDMSLPGNEKFITRANNYVAHDVATQMRATVFPPRATVFAKVGAALLLNSRRILTEPTIIDNNMMAATPTAADADFLYHFLCSVDFGLYVQTGALPSVNQTTLGAIPFPEFSQPEQTRIAEVLGAIDEAIEQTEALIAKNEQIKAGLMHDLFTRGVTPDGQLRPPREEAPKLYKQSPLGWIPKEWESERLAAKATVRGGKRLPVGHRFSEETTTFRYLHTTDFIGRPVTYEQLTYISRETFEALRSYEIVDGDIYISIAGVNLGWAGVFRPTITDRTILTENAAKILLGGGDSPEFVARQIDSESAQRQILVEAGIGAGVPKLALFRIKNLWLAWPNRNEQDQISSRCLSLDLILDTHQELRRKLAGQKAGLMHDLLTGRVRVPVPAQGSRA